MSINKGKSCWTLFVDALVLNDDGNVLGALSLATMAALANTRLPKVDVIMGADGEEPEIEVDGDMDNSVPLGISQVPVVVPLSLVRTWPP